MILIISGMLINKMITLNPFPALKAPAPTPLSFFFKIIITDEVVLVAKFGKISLAKETAKFNSAFLPKLTIILPRNPPA